MQYRQNKKNGDQISILGYGCMRLDKDEEKTRTQVAYAIEQGINYFDTAYIYPGNEALLGRVLTPEQRKGIHIATKLPPFMVNKREDMERIFRAQLERLQTDWIDYYLLHMLTKPQTWDRLVALGILPWLEEKKRTGQIRNIGFSFHGVREDFTTLIDAHDWDFCMIQYNYLDEHQQAGREGLLYANGKGIPVMVMEPLRGGRLATRLPKSAQAVWNEASIRRTPADWALRWLWDQPEPLTVLSGMNSMDIIRENARIAGEAAPQSLTQEEKALYARVRQCIAQSLSVPCTGCGYCMPCPAGVDIPQCFASLNERASDGAIIAQYRYVTRMYGHNASKCATCGACTRHCPQGIAIPGELMEVARVMESGLYRPMRFLAKRILRLS